MLGLAQAIILLNVLIKLVIKSELEDYLNNGWEMVQTVT